MADANIAKDEIGYVNLCETTWKRNQPLFKVSLFCKVSAGENQSFAVFEAKIIGRVYWDVLH